jgi:hypothetical protein
MKSDHQAQKGISKTGKANEETASNRGESHLASLFNRFQDTHIRVGFRPQQVFPFHHLNKRKFLRNGFREF